MLKIKGKEYPISVLKTYIHDSTLTKIDWLKKKLNFKQDIEVFTFVINVIHGQLYELETYYEKGVDVVEKNRQQELTTLDNNSGISINRVEIDDGQTEI